MIEFTALQDSPCTSSVIELDDVNILIDPGCDPKLKCQLESSLKPDLVLLCHSTLAHLGGYVSAFKNKALSNVPVYSTLPIINMGRMTLYEAMKSVIPDDLTMSDVDDAFDHISALRFSQATQLSSRCQGIELTAYNAGHTLGGTIWKIARGTEQILYAVDWNHAKDQHLNGCALFSAGTVLESLLRPSLMVTDAKGSSMPNISRSKRNTAFFDSISTTLLGGGSVLLPVDASSRCIELCEMIEQHWLATSQLSSIPVYFCAYTNTKMIGYAKSMLEWMSERMINEHGSTGNLLDFKHIKLLYRVSQVSMMAPGPKLIMATSFDIDSGFAQHILAQGLGDDAKNLILLTQPSSYFSNSLAGSISSIWSSESKSTQDNVPEAISLNLLRQIIIRRNVPLIGDELKAFNQAEQARRDAQFAKTAMEERNRNLLDADDSESEDEDEQAVLAAQATTGGKVNNALISSLGSSVLLYTSFDFHMDDPQNAKLPIKLKTFPFIDKRKRFDDYGEILKPDEFRRADEEEQDADTAVVAQKVNDGTGKKRKWNEIEDTKADVEMTDGIEEDRNVPCKLEEETIEITLRCQVRCIDMEGLHDGTSLKNIIESVNPRKLVIAHASTADKMDLKQACEHMRNFTKSVIVPETGVTTEVSLDAQSFEVSLSDPFAASLQWQKLSEQEVAHITGRLIPREKDDDEQPPILDVVTDADGASNMLRSFSLYIGDIKLTDLRKTLVGQGHLAELRGGGVLVCDDTVSITKGAAGQVLLKGIMGKQFYNVRDNIYRSLAVVQSA